jgi:predicted ribosomally synthesized peptide with SipW-like signal peptide
MSKTKTKRYLMLLAAIGLIAAGLGGTGTFASFTAETANNGNYFATGTLLLHNNGGTTTCTSESDANNSNLAGTGCDTLFKVAPLTSSTTPQWAHLTLTNAGSIVAADIKVSSPGCTTPVSSFGPNNLTVPLTAGSPVTSLTFSSLTGSIAVGDPILVTQGAHSQTFTATAAAAAAATTVTVASVNANFSYTTSASIANSPSFGAGDLCSSLQVIIVETATNSFNGDSPTGAVSCSYGVGNAGPPNNGCVFDPSKTLSTLPVSPTPLVDNDTSTNTTLDAGASRFFLIGIKPSGSFNNTFQNKRAQFDLHWQIDQA